MADQTLKLESGSQERVAFDLCMEGMRHLTALDGKEQIEQMLNVYQACLFAVRGGTVSVSKVK